MDTEKLQFSTSFARKNYISSWKHLKILSGRIYLHSRHNFICRNIHVKQWNKTTPRIDNWRDVYAYECSSLNCYNEFFLLKSFLFVRCCWAIDCLLFMNFTYKECCSMGIYSKIYVKIFRQVNCKQMIFVRQ